MATWLALTISELDEPYRDVLTLTELQGLTQREAAARLELVAKIEAAGGKVEAHFYPAGHAFFNDARPEAYSPDSAQKAWDRTLAFLRANLG